MTRNPAASPQSGPASDAGPAAKDTESWGGLLRTVALAVLAVALFRSFVFAPFTIPSESMLPRLMVGDYIVAAKWPYGYSRLSLPFEMPLIGGRILARMPERGDVVIFKHPVDGIDYVKRAIGLPGDLVQLVNGRVALNGRVLDRSDAAPLLVPVSANTACHGWAREIDGSDGDGGPACAYPLAEETLPSGRSFPVIDLGATRQDDFGPIRVPAGHVFVMGDNRDNSMDSRFPARAGGGVGLVSADLLVGRGAMILFSSDGSAEWLKPWTWFTAARWSRIGGRL